MAGAAIGGAVVNALGGVTVLCRSGEGESGGGSFEDEPLDRMGGNQRENEQARAAAREAGLDFDEQQILHREIHGKGLNYREVLDVAYRIKRGEIY